MSIYDIIHLENSVYSRGDFDSNSVKRMELGRGRFYYVLKDWIPFLRVEVDLTCSSFDTAIVFNDHLCIGVDNKALFIDLTHFECKKIDIKWCFGYFYIHRDRLLVLSGTGVIAFDNKTYEV